MNCVLFAKMDQVFSYKKKTKTLKKYWKNGKKYWKSTGKVREFCQSENVGTLVYIPLSFFLQSCLRLLKTILIWVSLTLRSLCLTIFENVQNQAVFQV